MLGVVGNVWLAILVLLGYLSYLLRGRTPKLAYDAMRRLYCRTDGGFNAICARGASVLTTRYSAPYSSGCLGDISEPEFKQIVQAVRRDGYFAFENLLDPELVRSLRGFAETIPCFPLSSLYPAGEPIIFKGQDVPFAKYDFNAESLVGDGTVQRLLCDTQLIAFAQEYLGARPVIDSVAMWWSARQMQASSEAAQLFHFDLDRLRFIKFFVYLTDVDTHSGPHCYVRGSHAHKPKELRELKRFDDEELHSSFSSDAFVEHLGRAGQVLCVDTSGFHKGKLPTMSHRLIFELEFSISLFGANYGRVDARRSDLRSDHREVVDRFPFVYKGIFGRE